MTLKERLFCGILKKKCGHLSKAWSAFEKTDLYGAVNCFKSAKCKQSLFYMTTISYQFCGIKVAHSANCSHVRQNSDDRWQTTRVFVG
jgi:hypothetical protein